MKHLIRSWLILALAWAAAVAVRAAESPPPAPGAVAPLPVEIPEVHNAFRVTDRIFSGSQPETDATFAELAKMGVKTVVSVDGSAPDIEKARKHGLHYVHLPFGYDGIPTNRVAELAKVMTLAAGPFYVHCHHGLHRGPAAVAVMCEASYGWTSEQAVAWLREAGTSTDYPGLYRAAREFQKPTPAQLASIKELPELTRPSSIVESMVSMDEHFSGLKRLQKAGWKASPEHPDLSPSHEATILWELIRELPRATDMSGRSPDFKQKLAESEQASSALRQLLSATPDSGDIDAAFARVTQSCSVCHKSYRNAKP